MKSTVLFLILGVTLSACATPRSIAPIVFQQPGFDHTKYQADLTDCYRMIEDQAPGLGDGASIAARTVGGALVGAVGGSVVGGAIGSAGRGAALGTAIGGTAGGIGAYESSERDKRRIYHQAVTTCLTLKGYQVMGATGGMR